MSNQIVSNPNDFKVVDFTNKTDFDFTPEMGCMFDSRPIYGISGKSWISAGESVKLPYHVGQRLATNLAKAVLNRQAPKVDPAGVPTGVPLWSAERLEALKNTFITDLYTESKPLGETEVDRLMRRVEELNKIVMEKVVKTAPIQGGPANGVQPVEPPKFLDKQEVIAELEKRKITFDARASKVELEKLLA